MGIHIYRVIYISRDILVRETRGLIDTRRENIRCNDYCVGKKYPENGVPEFKYNGRGRRRRGGPIPTNELNDLEVSKNVQ